MKHSNSLPSFFQIDLEQLKVIALAEANLAEQGATILKTASIDEGLELLCSPEELQHVAIAFKDPKLLANPNLLKWWNIVRKGHSGVKV